MQLESSSIKKVFRYRIVYSVIGIYTALAVFLAVTGFGGYVLYTTWEELSYLNTDVENNKDSVELIGNTRDLVAEGIDSYNETLQALIPDEESYFSVVSALETLAAKTGVVINSYTIDLESTNVSRLSLRVEVTGTEEALEKLLTVYKYGGGRLITIEKIDISRSGELTNVFLFNFYHQPYSVGSSSDQEQLTQKDIDMITDIQNQMN